MKIYGKFCTKYFNFFIGSIVQTLDQVFLEQIS